MHICYNLTMSHDTLDILRRNIKYYRKQRNYSQEKLSEITGISTDYLSEIERGKKMPSLKRLIIIADKLEVDTYKLLMPICTT